MENGLDEMRVIEDIGMNELTQIGIDKIGHKMRILKDILAIKQGKQPLQRSKSEGSTAYI